MILSFTIETTKIVDCTMSNYNKKFNETCFETFISDLEKNEEFENSPI